MYRMNTGYTVADALTEQPVTISPAKTLRDAAKVMAKEHVGALLVKDKETVCGIITEQDIVRKGVAGAGNAAARKVSDIMERKLITIDPSEDIFEALRIMRDENIRHLPVFANGQFAGLVTMKDILKIEPDLYEILVEKIELREAQRKPLSRRN
ncbi:MAG TPA: CBS domain-containing protein [Candidatus Nanoarchaeia archaeon]|nr:CBS domain-containing protein [Candidatus Nanoarchaeia archaeon]